MQTRRPARRSSVLRGTRSERGAALVEYALIIALLVVPTIGAAQYLTTQSSAQTNNQADCISQRPPPPSCQVKAITTTTSTTAPPSTTTSSSSTTTSSTSSTVPPPVGAGAWDLAASTWNSGTRKITAQINLTEDPGATPIAGATVVFRMTVTPGGQSFAATCVSSAAGVCTATFDVPVGITQVVGRVQSVDSTPPTSPLPSDVVSWTTT